jgi:hypothetical protein
MQLESFVGITLLIIWISIHLVPIIVSLMGIIKYIRRKQKFKLFIFTIVFILSMIPSFLLYHYDGIDAMRSILPAIIMCLVTLLLYED